MKAPWQKLCTGCGRALRAADWFTLPRLGLQVVDGEPALELRNCQCGSTIAVPLAPESREAAELEQLRHRLADQAVVLEQLALAGVWD